MKVVDLNDLPVKEEIKVILKRRGIVSLNPVQSEAVEKGLLEGKRLLLTSPTGSGKTLIAELGMLSHLMRGERRAVYVTPLRALTSEKFVTFKDWEALGIKVGMTSGDYDTDDRYLSRYDLVVTTYEKLDSLWRHKPEWLLETDYFVLDEFHYLNDGTRGPVVESVAIRAKRNFLLALSATVSNSSQIAQWLSAIPITTNWRPVPLKEGILVNERRRSQIYYSDGSSYPLAGSDPILSYTEKVVNEGGQVLVFRNSRKMAETTAWKIKELDLKLKKDEIKGLLSRLEEVEDAGSTEKEALKELIASGVAFHHAGLSRGLREVIEDGFRRRIIKVITATPTLAAGVNLPARSVVVGDIYRFNKKILGYQEEISVMEYKQMSGRAGRPGYDTEGESVIVVRNRKDAERVARKYILSPPEPIESKLGNESAFYSFLLGIASDVSSEDEITEVAQESLLDKELVKNYIEKGLAWLRENGFLEGVKLTRFGRRVADLYIKPFTARVIKDTISMNSSENCDIAYFHMLSMTPDAPVVNVSEQEGEDLIDMAYCPPFVDPEEGDEGEEYYSALKIALILHDWIEEVEEDQILSKYRIGSGDLRSIVETMDRLTYSGYQLAQVLDLKDHEKILLNLNRRVSDGVKEELVDLVKVSGVGRKRGRLLYERGIRKPEDIVMNPDKVKALLGEKLGERIVKEAARLLGGVL
ncbi:DEAD/DEAH box helicase [Metallosphaera tengchongensis]|uniref:ATP-dependent DNA helicase Hel308 n=1 Tax=Metallosphaera tengchongensis TaxID=1532350 RepID=A0A6N0NVC5_9CREN|nr:ATP-dependent DNA helicase Hel308 [Metallosphaera tengchongensis]QKQ99109.1 DEAD/DEAH box helicase [Metallosphaera tengchongensis]